MQWLLANLACVLSFLTAVERLWHSLSFQLWMALRFLSSLYPSHPSLGSIKPDLRFRVHKNFVHQELLKQNNLDCISLVSQTPAGVARIVWFWLNVHKCIPNGVSESLFLICVSELCAESCDSWLLPLFTHCFPVVLWGQAQLPTPERESFWEY